jgi:uncharacterized membrane protein SpoIIM required for sporulation
VDLDAFVTEHRGEWSRLRQLADRRTRRLSAAEVDEMVALYHRTATHLSLVRSRSPDPALVAWLSRVVLRARAALTPSPGFSLAGVGRFLTVSFPLEVYRARWWCLGVAVLFLALTGVQMAVVAGDPARFATPAEIERYVWHDFEAYYSTYAPENFALLVWTNNAQLAAVCLAAGVLILPVLVVLGINIGSLGTAGGIMVAYGRADVFFGLILVHGLLEVTVILIAAGVGLRIGWAWIAPGADRTRTRALAQRARSGMVVALGLALALLVSGLIEAFVTPLAVPVLLKLAFGTAVWVAFLAYVVTLGGRAAGRGASADVDPLDRPAAVATG